MKLFTSLLFLGLMSTADGDTCTGCESTYTTARDTGGATDAEKCTALEAYLDCLETAAGTGCPLTTAQAAQISTDLTAISGSCTLDALCGCQKDYWSTDISGGNPADCTAAKTRVTCLRGKTGTACDGTSAINVLGTTTESFLTAISGTCSLNAACTCEKNYVKADVSDDTKMCTQSLAFIGCLKGIDGTLCDGSDTVAAGAGAADTVQAALSSPACSPSDGCNCEITYAKADIGDDTKKCTQAGTFISCLKTKTGTGCDGSTTVAAMAGTADTAMTSSITGCTQSDGCVCEAAYAKADISDDAKKCTQAGTFLSCLKTKTGTGCDETTTVATMAGTADTAMGTITGCTQSAGCACESTYAQADISTSAKKCTEAKKFISCLKTEEGTGCDGSTTVASLATSTNTYIGTLSGCTKSDACTCEVAYASADISDDTKKCTEVKKYISCLKSKTGMGCDGTTTVVQLATAAGTTASGITGCTLTATTCQCELDYAKADISDDTKLCTETKNYVDCLMGKATTGCVDSKSTLVTAAETTMSGITGGACDITSTVCACDAAYAKLDTSTDALKCTAEKNYISCLLGKTGTGCDGSTTLIASATAAESAITTIGATCTKTSVCDCEIAYAKADISTNALKCAATKDLTTCTMLSIDNGCGASTTKTNVGSVASTAFTALSTNCATTTTCDCQATFNAADVTSSAKCTSANALITCLDAITSTTETACDGTQLTTELKTNVTTSVQAVLCSFGARVEASSFVAVLMMTMSVLVISL